MGEAERTGSDGPSLEHDGGKWLRCRGMNWRKPPEWECGVPIGFRAIRLALH